MTAVLALLVLGIAWSSGSGPGDSRALAREETIMDSSDSGAAQPRDPRTSRPALPEILSLAVERVRVEPRKYKFVESVLADEREATAFTIEVKGTLRLDMNATPVLYVGEVELSACEQLGDGRYRFLAFAKEQKAMRAGAPISLGWPGHKPHPETRFRYEGVRR
jgi:hypothetical protein